MATVSIRPFADSARAFQPWRIGLWCGALAMAGAMLNGSMVSGLWSPALAQATGQTGASDGPAWATLTGAPPEVIAHRGASGQRPEHTIEAYERAIDQGADWIEPDLVLTRDGVLIARHDRYLSTTTDVSERPDFADRKQPKTVYGETRTDWWAEDFTLAEIKSLRARQPFPGRSEEFDGLYTVPTFEEVIALAQRRSTADRVVGVMPEIKQPGALGALGFDVAGLLVAALEGAGWREESAPVVIQSFEPEILLTLAERSPVRLAQLVFPDPSTGLANLPLEKIAAYADSVGPAKLLVVDAEGQPTDFIARAHELGLAVYPWTFRDDQRAADGAPIEAELERVFGLGADGVFADFPDTAVAVRDAMVP